MRRTIKYGFTLVELLVVISIIALLLAIMMPALQRARSSAKAVVCMTNMRQLALGLDLYQNDNKYFLPPIAMDINGKLPDMPGFLLDPASHTTWINKLYKYLPKPSDGKPNIYMCPTFAPAIWQPDDVYSYTRTYGMQKPAQAWDVINIMRPKNFNSSRPCDLILVADSYTNDIGLAEKTQDYYLDQSDMFFQKKYINEPAKFRQHRIHLRHRNKGNVVFGDMHVKAMDRKQLENISWWAVEWEYQGSGYMAKR